MSDDAGVRRKYLRPVTGAQGASGARRPVKLGAGRSAARAVPAALRARHATASATPGNEWVGSNFMTLRHAALPHSHSMVLGGLEEMSYTTRLIPLTSLIILFEIRASSSWGSLAQSAVMPSTLLTARRAMTFS